MSCATKMPHGGHTSVSIDISPCFKSCEIERRRANFRRGIDVVEMVLEIKGEHLNHVICRIELAKTAILMCPCSLD